MAPPTEAAPAKRSVWHIPLKWFSEESFWRDVTKSAVSTGLVALIAYLYALGAGYIATPPGVAVGVMVLSTLSLTFMLLSARAIHLRNFSGARPLLYLGFALFVAMAIIDLTRDDRGTLWDRIAFHWTTTLALAGIAVAMTSTLQMKHDRKNREAKNR